MKWLAKNKNFVMDFYDYIEIEQCDTDADVQNVGREKR